MLITQTNSDFFSPLSGKNGKIIEQVIISLYNTTYGDDFSSEEILDRRAVVNIVLRVVQEIAWQKEDEEFSLESDRDKSSYVIKRLIDCGWVAFITNRGLSIKTFNFTKNGKKMAQMLASMSDEENLNIRQRNVRSTRSLLESYQKSNDPYDLLDAMNFSKHIVSDLTDNIYDLKEEKNQLMMLAIKDISQASGKFIEFLEEKFTSDLAVKFGEDSANRHRLEIMKLIHELLDDPQLELRERKLIRLVPAYRKRENPLRNILYAIQDRLINACDSKLPQLKNEISTYVQRGEIIFRQTNSLIFNKNKEITQVAEVLRSKSKEEKIELLDKIGAKLSFPNLKILNLSSVVVRKKRKKEQSTTFLKENEVIPKEVYIQSQFEQRKHQAFNFTQAEIRTFIDEHFETNSQISNTIFKIAEPKDLLIALYSSDIMYRAQEDYTFKATKNRVKNIYFESDEYIIMKKNLKGK